MIKKILMFPVAIITIIPVAIYMHIVHPRKILTQVILANSYWVDLIYAIGPILLLILLYLMWSKIL